MSPSSPAKRRGLVLGAGGVLGAAWTIGALAALEEETGWDPRTAEIIIGTSAGSVLAALLGSGIGVSTLLNHQRGVVVPGDPQIEFDYEGAPLPPWPRLRLGSPGLLRQVARHPRRVTPLTALASILPEGRGSVAPIGALIEAAAGAGAWASHPHTWLIATDYATGKRVVFGRTGAPKATLAEAVMASCSIPGWYAPMTIGGRRYIDGGSCSAASLDLLAGRDLDEVYVLSPMTSWSFDRPASRTARAERYLRRLVTKRIDREAERVRTAGTSVFLLGPGAEDLEVIGANLMDPRRREQVLEKSLETSAAELRRLRAGLAQAG